MSRTTCLDVLGPAAIARGVVPVATCEHTADRVMSERFPQADALRALESDATRVVGVEEDTAILLLAADFGVRACGHAGGVGPREAVQHRVMVDFTAVAGSLLQHAWPRRG